MKVLFIHQEITPYLKETPMSLIGRYLPQGIQERGKEIRIFMPRFGNINELHNQLHEVIRLSGMNMIINDTDHPLIIKVASIQKARIQIYFIDDNDELFAKRKFTTVDKNKVFFEDNDDRTMFFSRGVIETVRKLNWPPDIIHCHGWMTSLVPLFIKRAFKDNPLFSDSKVVYSLYDDDFEGAFRDSYEKKLKMPGIIAKEIKWLKNPTYANIQKSALDFSDAIVMASPNINPEVEKYARSLNKPILEYPGEENYVDAYNEFYDKIK
ncbi:MAG: glycogen/starch synthase [Bacteroidales bacterium]|nr:glycogen/starch synthase [Bacteroidales bacterium]MBQ3844639.1 glycogen/starch synthase [Bacteroidales bacterium]MBQ3845912.1 glycogen/starch synthase [Bacteroidales bacterium]